jgi:calcium/calmodulin-dependent protein kinase I
MEEIYVDWQDGYQAGGIIHVIMEKIEGQEMFAVINSLGHYTGKRRVAFFF